MIKEILNEQSIKGSSSIDYKHGDENNGYAEHGLYLNGTQIFAFDDVESQAPYSFEKGVGGIWVDGEDSYREVVKTKDLIKALETLTKELKKL